MPTLVCRPPDSSRTSGWRLRRLAHGRFQPLETHTQISDLFSLCRDSLLLRLDDLQEIDAEAVVLYAIGSAVFVIDHQIRKDLRNFFRDQADVGFAG